jgi:hypothetical protein
LTATAAGSSRVGLNWASSTDNVGVSGYRAERSQGAGCTNFAEVATPTATAYSDTAISLSTTYRYRVRAIDPSRNLGGYSTVAEATTAVAPPTPPGLVGAWAFDEGPASPPPMPPAGEPRDGHRVRVADSASLDLTTAMTLSAWNLGASG